MNFRERHTSIVNENQVASAGIQIQVEEGYEN